MIVIEIKKYVGYSGQICCKRFCSSYDLLKLQR